MIATRLSPNNSQKATRRKSFDKSVILRNGPKFDFYVACGIRKLLKTCTQSTMFCPKNWCEVPVKFFSEKNVCKWFSLSTVKRSNRHNEQGRRMRAQKSLPLNRVFFILWKHSSSSGKRTDVSHKTAQKIPFMFIPCKWFLVFHFVAVRYMTLCFYTNKWWSWFYQSKLSSNKDWMQTLLA